MGILETFYPEGQSDRYERHGMAGAVRASGLVFVSGQLGFRDGALSPDPEEQFAAAWENVRRALAPAGCDLDDIVDIHSFHTHLNEHQALFAAVKQRFITAPFPTWTAIGAAQLAPGAYVEIKVVALAR
jgi:enamine deaminase RidA (YjgF/YER057c/UK114 family)